MTAEQCPLPHTLHERSESKVDDALDRDNVDDSSCIGRGKTHELCLHQAHGNEGEAKNPSQTVGDMRFLQAPISANNMCRTTGHSSDITGRANKRPSLSAGRPENVHHTRLPEKSSRREAFWQVADIRFGSAHMPSGCHDNVQNET